MPLPSIHVSITPFLHSFLAHKFLVQGPVVQSIVSLMSSLRVISLTVIADSIHNILIFFAEKMWVAFHIFAAKKFQHICISLNVNFNESLTNDVISFEQLGSDLVFMLNSFCFNKIIQYIIVLWLHHNVLTHCTLNRIYHTIYWKSPISILGTRLGQDKGVILFFHVLYINL